MSESTHRSFRVGSSMLTLCALGVRDAYLTGLKSRLSLPVLIPIASLVTFTPFGLASHAVGQSTGIGLALQCLGIETAIGDEDPVNWARSSFRLWLQHPSVPAGPWLVSTELRASWECATEWVNSPTDQASVGSPTSPAGSAHSNYELPRHGMATMHLTGLVPCPAKAGSLCA